MNKQKLLAIVGGIGFLLIILFLIFGLSRRGSDTPSPVVTSTPTVPPVTTPTSTADPGLFIRVSNPLPNQIIQSPLLITGEARGNWYFEASFPVRLLDANGRQLAAMPAQAESDWMTESFVPFRVSMVFSAPTTQTGTLVLEKDNPSGLPQNAAEIRIPVRFDMAGTTSTNVQRAVKLYYYDPARDRDGFGNILCSARGLVAVDRMTPRTMTPIADTIRLLLKGALTPEERARGITTEFPLSGLELRLAAVTGTSLILTFNDPENRTSGGSCRAIVLWAQIEATAKQFTGFSRVLFRPETLFQP